MFSRVLALCAVLGMVGILAAEDAVDYGPLPPPQSPEIETISEPSAVIRDAEVRPAASVDSQSTPVDKHAQLEQKLREAAELQSEINTLRNEIGANEQILVRVEMVEVSLTKLRKLGVDFAALGQGSDRVERLDQLRQVFKVTAAGPNAKESSPKSSNGPSSFVEWLEENNIAKVLARPNMVVVNGRPATMFVGTELPTPAIDDSKTIQFQKCGTEVSVLAIARDHEHVRMELRARVSEPDDSRSIGVEGSRIPAMKVRECDTAVETSFGEPVIVDGNTETRIESTKTENGVVDTPNEVALLIVATPDHVESKKAAGCQSCPYSEHASGATNSTVPQCVAVAAPQQVYLNPYCEACNSAPQKPVAQSQPPSNPAPQYRLQFHAFQISSDELEKIGVAWPEAGDGFTPDRVTMLRTAINEAIVASKNSSQPLAPLEKDDLDGVLDWLGHHGAVKILADPTIAVTSGHPTSFSNLHGPSYPGPNGKGGVEPCQCGVTIDCTATEKNADLVQLNLNFKHVEPFDSDASSPTNPNLPAVSISKCCTTLTLTNGKTFVLDGLVSSSENGSGTVRTEKLIAVTADRIKPKQTANLNSPCGNEIPRGFATGTPVAFPAPTQQEADTSPCEQSTHVFKDSSVKTASETEAAGNRIAPISEVPDSKSGDEERQPAAETDSD